ncbi:D-glycerate dehydrogenase [candidate division WOR-3 bacterium]|nr:D-glycerate dehydrogenase [candidate division WOR-3 bacterium]
MSARPKVLLTRMLPGASMEVLEKHFELDANRENRVMPHGVLVEKVKDKDGLICLLTDRIDRPVIAGATRLKIIADYAVGYDNIDLAEASKRKIPVTNTPDVLTETTADLAFGLLLSIARRIVESDRFLRAGGFKGWAPELMLGIDVHNKTLGIIGMGRIGRAVARRARGFDMKVLYYDVQPLSAVDEKGCGVEYCPLNNLLDVSDFVSVHAPLNAQTHHLISAAEFRGMKRTAFLINTARGPIIDEKALVHALKSGQIAGCALDVYENEPAITTGLLGMDNVVLVPHIGSASIETRTKMALMAAGNVIAVLIDQKKPPNIVNPGIYA